MLESEYVGVPMTAVSAKITSSETRIVYATPFIDPETASALQDSFGEIYAPNSVGWRIINVRHPGNTPHPSHQALRWEASWDSSNDSRPEVALAPSLTKEGPSPAKPIDPFSL